MKKRLTSFVLVLALFFSFSLPAFAVYDSNYYSFPPVADSDPPFIHLPVSLAVSHDGFLAEDSNNLARIMTDLTTTGLTTLKSYVLDIRDSLSRGGAIFDFLSDITDALTAHNTRGTLVWYIKDIYNLLSSIQASLGGGLATEVTLSGLHTSLNNIFAVADPQSSADPSPTKRYGIFSKNLNMYRYVTFGTLMTEFTNYLNRPVEGNGDKTLYGYVMDLGLVLANDEDKAIRDQQKENQDTIKNNFLSGSSSGSSLGKDDFSNASQVGGALHDTFNMGGAAKVSDFLSGFGSAGSESQAWFSQTTANNLNAVASGDGLQGVSSFADYGATMVDVDPDPYNMASIFDRYDWLEGVSIDD